MRLLPSLSILLVAAELQTTSAWIPRTMSSSSSTVSSTPRAVGHSNVRPATLLSATEDAAAADDDDAAFKLQCQQLCDERNLKLEKVKNARDLASCQQSPVLPGRLLRTGRISDATTNDLRILMNDNENDSLDLRTLIDLRSPTELKDDATLLREEVFGDYTTMVWVEPRRKSKKVDESKNKSNGIIKELPDGVSPVQKRSRALWERVDQTTEDDLEAALEELVVDEECGIDSGDDDDESAAAACFEEEEVVSPHYTQKVRKERHFVSLMNEFKYVKGTVGRLRKRDLAKAALRSPGAIFSKTVRSKVKEPFLNEINDGGLPMLNELLLRFGAPGIRYVLELCSDPGRHPVAFYCTAGKDRTGMIAAIVLSLCGADREHIVEDYSLSANVYAEMNDHQAMVGALSQRNLCAKTFLGAPPQVMRDTLDIIQEQYGSVEDYCTWIGFGPEKQAQLIEACTKPDPTTTTKTAVEAVVANAEQAVEASEESAESNVATTV